MKTLSTMLVAAIIVLIINIFLAPGHPKTLRYPCNKDGAFNPQSTTTCTANL